MQKHTFTGGSFVLHKVRLPMYQGRFSVWADADGNMTDCEYVNERNPSLSSAIPVRNTVLRAALAKVARDNKDLAE